MFTGLRELGLYWNKDMIYPLIQSNPYFLASSSFFKEEEVT